VSEFDPDRQALIILTIKSLSVRYQYWPTNHSSKTYRGRVDGDKIVEMRSKLEIFWNILERDLISII
jgi:hypothetical protein